MVVKSLRTLIFFMLLSATSMANASDTCATWFKDSGVKQDTSCLLDCAAHPVDMATFACHDQCDSFCKMPQSTQLIFQLSDLYPGLTSEEKALVALYPKEMLKAYRLSHDAEKICGELYPTSRTNDESDACRHFVWAGILVRDLNADLAEKILTAHEQEPRQPEDEKAMDLANNRRAQTIATALAKNKNLSEKEILKAFNVELKSNRLIVLKKHAGGAK